MLRLQLMLLVCLATGLTGSVPMSKSDIMHVEIVVGRSLPPDSTALLCEPPLLTPQTVKSVCAL